MDNSAFLTTKISMRPESTAPFADWQAQLHAAITSFPGFISLEISLVHEETYYLGNIVQRFSNSNTLSDWLKSDKYQELLRILKEKLADEALGGIREVESTASQVKGNVTEVFVTQVSPEKENAYQEHADHWMTFLHFDTPENLDRWLMSPERQKVLKESESLIVSLESHRVVSPYAGWFASKEGGAIAPVWKQTMLVLLVLFPIVMLELKFLSPLTAGLNDSLAMFIGNIISVSLIAWPCMPIVLKFLDWWLTPKGQHPLLVSSIGTFFVFSLYVFEIFIFWR
jgi:hypothetical protein